MEPRCLVPAWLVLVLLSLASSPAPAGDAPPFQTTRTVKATGREVPSGRTVDLVLEIDDGPATFKLDVPEKGTEWGRAKRGGAPREPAMVASFVEAAAMPHSAAWLPSLELAGQKGKFFDDGVFAALELAIEEGIDGVFVGTQRWLAGMCDALRGGTPTPGEPAGVRRALVYLATAYTLGGHPIRDLALDPTISKAAAESALGFVKQDSLNSTPTSFHTWNTTLERIFRETRWLMTPLDAGDPDQRAALSALVEVLREHADLASGLKFLVELNARLTNPSRDLSILDLLAGRRLEDGGKVSLLPRAESPEIDFLTRTGASGLAPGEAMQAFIDRVKDGSLSLRPGEGSGWYAHKLFALESFLKPDLPESEKLRMDDRYRRRLEAAFASLLTQARETHEIQMSIGAGPLPKEEMILIHLDVAPEIEVEPLPSYYERLYRAYAFLEEQVLNARLDPGGGLSRPWRWEGIKPFSLGKPGGADLRKRLDDTKRLFLGLALVSRRNLGLPLECPQPAGCAEALSFAESWLARWRSDPEMKQDIRVITPVAVTASGKLLSWAVLGIRNLQVDLSYDEEPVVRVVTDLRKKVDLRVRYHAQRVTIAVPVFASVLLPDARPLSREDFREVCDRYKTPKAIVAALERGAR